MTDDERAFLAAFEAATLPSLPHEDHVRAAFLLVRDEPLAVAIDRLARGLARFAAARGAPERYHETLTWAWALLVHERIADRRGATAPTWDEFAAANGDLLARGRSPLERWYRPETLASATARSRFVLPDRVGAP